MNDRVIYVGAYGFIPEDLIWFINQGIPSHWEDTHDLTEAYKTAVDLAKL